MYEYLLNLSIAQSRLRNCGLGFILGTVGHATIDIYQSFLGWPSIYCLAIPF